MRRFAIITDSSDATLARFRQIDNTAWQRRIGGQKSREKEPIGYAASSSGYESRMTESRIGCSVRSSRLPRQFMTIGIATVMRSRDTAGLQEDSSARQLIKLIQLVASVGEEREREKEKEEETKGLVMSSLKFSLILIFKISLAKEKYYCIFLQKY